MPEQPAICAIWANPANRWLLLKAPLQLPTNRLEKEIGRTD